MRWIAFCGLQYRVGVGWSIRLLVEKSIDSYCSQIASNVAMYSAYVVESVVHSFSFDLHEIALPP